MLLQAIYILNLFLFDPIVAVVAFLLLVFAISTLVVVAVIICTVVDDPVGTSPVDLVAFAIFWTGVGPMPRTLSNGSLRFPVESFGIKLSMFRKMGVRGTAMIIPHNNFVSVIQVIISVSIGKITPADPSAPLEIDEHGRLNIVI